MFIDMVPIVQYDHLDPCPSDVFSRVCIIEQTLSPHFTELLNLLVRDVSAKQCRQTAEAAASSFISFVSPVYLTSMGENIM